MSDRTPPLGHDDVAILGLGASGTAAAHLALHKGETVYVSDTRTDASTSARGTELRSLGADVELGRHDVERVARAGTVVASPGIPPDAPVLRALRERGARWVSEPEYAFRFLPGSLIAVTGTNGKTTTSALIAHLLSEGGVRVGLGGNIGAGLGPAASELALREPAPGWVVLEVSSFQLADIDRFRPDIGVVTNLAPDHLDRYPDVESYYADKARLFDNADPDARWVLNGDDPAVLDLAGDAEGDRYLFTLEPPGDAAQRGGRVDPGASRRAGSGTDAAPRVRGVGFLRDDVLVLRMDGRDEPLVSWDEVPLLGRHSRANALAAALVARLAGLEPEAIAAGLRTVQGLPHRLEPVGEVGGVLWVNDSKATNVAAAVSAVRSLDGRALVLLLGGKDKGEALEPLVTALSGTPAGGLRAVLCYGAAGPRFARALRPAGLPVELMGSDFEAVLDRAARLSEPGDAVLLAPACSSFDMFEDYEDRGDTFRRLVTGRAA